MNAKSLMKLVALLLAGLVSATANAALISRDFAGNDCSGYFGTGFDSCTIFINEAGERIEISPVIAKYKGDLSFDEANGDLYPSVNGSEFTFTNTTTGNKTGDWSYAPVGDDPGVRYWATKAGNAFTLFWEVDGAAAAGVCNVADAYTLGCLNEALTVSAGSWTTPGNKELSHITFYDSEPPVVVPLPAAVWLFGTGLLGLVGVARRKNRA